ncbi:MAG: hypothetical protein AMS16_03255 [Planctomycetes bacterium DG_58]|nr:MAG: hypothetical protein AMS16_03255 [Planctomycetes bacterium DG_58]
MNRFLVSMVAFLGLWIMLAATSVRADDFPGKYCFAFDPVFIQGDMRQPEKVSGLQKLRDSVSWEVRSDGGPLFELDLTINGE